jgi:hypothetical protein
MKTNDEIRARIVELTPIVKGQRAMFDAACAMPEGAARSAAFEEYFHVDDEGEHVDNELDALEDLMPDLEALEEAVRQVGTVELSPQQLVKLQEKVAELRHKVVVDHIRNARNWQELFGSESTTRIDVFSKIIDVEPNYEPLDDVTEEEKAMFAKQMHDALAPILEEINKEK